MFIVLLNLTCYSEHYIIHVPYEVHTVHHHHVKKVPVYIKSDYHHHYDGWAWRFILLLVSITVRHNSPLSPTQQLLLWKPNVCRSLMVNTQVLHTRNLGFLVRPKCRPKCEFSRDIFNYAIISGLYNSKFFPFIIHNYPPILWCTNPEVDGI